ncbi:MAG: CoA transferase [Deltaproteobacteria bacterium]|nr:CoA transferase [Deltaproteobacteria bacterium]
MAKMNDESTAERWAEPSGPLRGVRIVDLTTMVSGPLATRILADQGADVVKIEPPGKGDLLRAIGDVRGGISAIFNTMNRSKRSLVLDLSKPQGTALLDRLVERADVFIQNFRPGTAERMGIGAERLCKLDPRLIYVSISGFGEKGPGARRPVYDSVMQAYSGIAASQANPETGVPEFVRNIMCDKSTATTVAQAITAALFARERGEGGQHLHISMLHASVAFLWPDTMESYTYLDPLDPLDPLNPGDGIDARDGEARHARGDTLPAIRATADGYITFTAIHDAEFAGLCRAVGREDLIDDPRFAQTGPRTAHASQLHAILNPIARKRTTAEWVERLLAEGVPHAVVNDLATLHEDPQIVANDVLVEQVHPLAGRQRQPRPVPEFEATPAAIQSPAPGLGQHSEEVLGELGLAADEIAVLRQGGVLG